MYDCSIMKIFTKVSLAIIAVLAFAGIWLAGSYNGLVRLSQDVDAQWAQVETQYQRRYDLIPNLVESTKGIFTQEQEVFGQIAEARTRYAGAESQGDQVAAANELESALGRLLVIVENYPQLQSNQTVLALMDELAGTENRVSVERKRYNDIARTYNTKVKTIPTVFIAGWLGFSDKAYFAAVSDAAEAPTVNLNTQ